MIPFVMVHAPMKRMVFGNKQYNADFICFIKKKPLLIDLKASYK